jgi:membrane-associated phospholipid phosphatase
MKLFFATLPRNIIECFKGRMLLWHLTAIILSIVLVVSGLDWQYFLGTRFRTLWSLFFPAVPIGGLLPIALPLILLVSGAIIRAHPAHGDGTDLTHVFKFGLLRGGVFWGWPSSHTTIAFAMAVTVFKLYPKQKWLGYLAITYAFYIGLGVSITIHWLSDFVAGALIGSAIGIVVATCFSRSRNA